MTRLAMFMQSVAGQRQRLAGTAAALALAAAAATGPAQADTTVEFRTSLGVFDVSLYDSVTPATVANFMAYVNSHRYDDTLVHRSVANFVIQGGGYNTDFTGIATLPPVVNEAGLSNVRGTLAVARFSSNLNSGTSQWYINTVDNTFLDADRWTVFGVVLGNGMQVVDAIAALPTYDYSALNPALLTLPLRNFSGAPGSIPGLQNLVSVSISAVPEPASGALLGLGLLVLTPRLRRAARRPACAFSD